MLSTQNLSAFPDILTMRKTCQALAVLEAIISPEWEYRYYSYNAHWDEDAKEEVASMRDGEGDEYLILFNDKGAIINGFAHESAMNGWQDEDTQQVWAGVLDSVPTEFKNFIVTEPIPSTGTTFCIWRKYTDTSWQIGKIDFPDDDYADGSEMLSILDGNPITYQKFVEEYYEQEVALDLIQKVYAHETITREIVLAINPDIENWDDLRADLDEIGVSYKGF